MAVLLPADRAWAPESGVLLVLLYPAARQVGFEIATGYTCPLILVLIPMLFHLPPSPPDVTSTLVRVNAGDCAKQARLIRIHHA